MIDEARKRKLGQQIGEVVILADDYYSKYPWAGPLHIVVEDYNFLDCNLGSCLERVVAEADQMGPDEMVDAVKLIAKMLSYDEEIRWAAMAKVGQVEMFYCDRCGCAYGTDKKIPERKYNG